MSRLVPLLIAVAACKADPDATEPVPVKDVVAEVSPDVVTMVRVSWSQSAAAEVWLEFDPGDGAQTSPRTQREAGDHSEWILGVPADTDVGYRVITENLGATYESDAATVTTGSLPQAMTTPTALTPGTTSPERFVLGSVDVDGGEAYYGPFWLFIADRQGRIVWYREVGYYVTMFPRVARDGTHLAWDQHHVIDAAGDQSSVTRTTLDGTWTEGVSTPGLGWAWDETDDGTILYDRVKPDPTVVTLEAVAPDGTQTTIWNCSDWLAPLDADPEFYEHCYSNTVNWVAGNDSVLWSTYWGDWIGEIDLGGAGLLWHAGAVPGGLTVNADAALDLQHYPNYTPDGTLIVSTHVPGVDGTQRAREFTVGPDSLDEVWVYGEGVDQWAQYSGEAVRLDNGNTLINYGTQGEVREVAPDGTLLWSLQFGDTLTLGHTELIADLYALNQGR